MDVDEEQQLREAEFEALYGMKPGTRRNWVDDSDKEEEEQQQQQQQPPQGNNGDPAAEGDDEDADKAGESQAQDSAEPEKPKKRRFQEAIDAGAPNIGIKSQGGLVIEDTGYIIYKVPERVEVVCKDTGLNRYGEHRNCYVGKPKHPMCEVPRGDRYRREAELKMSKNLKHLSRIPGVDMSRTVVKLGLRNLGWDQNAIEELFTNGKRFEQLPMLPPFGAFKNPVRQLLTQPSDDPTRILPSSFFTLPYITARESLSYATVDGVEELNTPRDNGTFVQNDRMFNIRSTFTSSIQTLWQRISVMDVHLFNTLHDELFTLSGVKDMLQSQLPPFSPTFSSNSLLGPDGSVPFIEESYTPWTATALDEDSMKAMREFVDSIAAISLPLRRYFMNYGHSQPKRLPALADEVLTSFYQECYKAGEAVFRVPEQLRPRAEAWLRGYIDWRYFVLPDLVAGCLALNYEIVNPSLDRGFLVVCPANERAYPERLYRVSKTDGCADPCIDVLFPHLAADYDRWACAVMLFNMTCGKKASFIEERTSVKREKSKIIRRFFRIEIVPLKNAKLVESEAAETPSAPAVATTEADYDPVADHVAVNRKGSPCFKLLSDRIKASYNTIYGWTRYPMLCNIRAEYDTSKPRGSKRNKPEPPETGEGGGDDDEGSSGSGSAATAAAAATQASAEQACTIDAATTTTTPKTTKPPPKKLRPEERAEKLLKILREKGEGDEPTKFKPAATPFDYSDSLVKALACDKAERRNNIVAIIPPDRIGKIPEHKADLEMGLNIFNNLFSMVKPSKMYKGQHKVDYTCRRAAELIHSYMKYHGALKSNLTPAELRACITGCRKECPGIDKVTVKNQQLLFKLKEGSALYLWTLSNTKGSVKASKNNTSKEPKKKATTVLSGAEMVSALTRKKRPYKRKERPE